MKIYIVERDSSDYRSEPEVFTDYDEAYASIKREFDEMVKVIPEDSFAENDGYELSISEPNGDYCFWRITEHTVKERRRI